MTLKQVVLNSILVSFIVLVGANVAIFVHSIRLSDEINRFERDLKTVHQENLSLEKKVNEIDSLRFADSIAASLGFVKKAQPLYLDHLKYAKKP